MAQFVTRRDLEARLGADRVVELFDDDGDGSADEELLAEVLDDANKELESVLFKKGFGLDQLNNLSRDRLLRRSATEIAAQLSGERRTEWLDDKGKGPYDALGERGRRRLEKLSHGELRASLEARYGGNTTVRGAVAGPTPKFVFNPDPTDPRRRGPGGF